MSEKQNYDIYEDEIDLKEIFMVLWKGKKLIISITLIFALLTGLVTIFLIDPVYEAKLDIVISIPETVTTKYGDYKMLMTTNEQYINLIHSNDVIQMTINDMNYDMNKNSIESFSNRISITKDDKNPNSFKVIIKANKPDEALQVANSLYKNYISFLNKTLKSNSINYFLDFYTTQINIDKASLALKNELLRQYNDLLAKTPQTINQKDALSTVNINSIDYVVLEDIINENYTKIELDIITLEQEMYNLELNTTQSNQYIEELNKIKTSLDENNQQAAEYLKAIDNSIYLPSQPVAPSHKTSPSTTLNIIIGAVIGGMISVLFVLIKKYWFTEKNN